MYSFNFYFDQKYTARLCAIMYELDPQLDWFKFNSKQRAKPWSTGRNKKSMELYPRREQ